MTKAKNKGSWHGAEGIFSFAPGSVVFSPRDLEENAVVWAGNSVSVARLYAQITQLRATLREEGHPKIRVEVQVSPAQLRLLKHDPLYPHSQGWPIAYAYPGVPHPTKTYFYGVLVRRVKWVHETSTNNNT